MKIIKKFSLKEETYWNRRLVSEQILTLTINTNLLVSEGEILMFDDIKIGCIDNITNNVNLKTGKRNQTVYLFDDWYCDNKKDKEETLEKINKEIEKLKEIGFEQ
jgi:hypothetical protein